MELERNLEITYNALCISPLLNDLSTTAVSSFHTSLLFPWACEGQVKVMLGIMGAQ